MFMTTPHEMNKKEDWGERFEKRFEKQFPKLWNAPEYKFQQGEAVTNDVINFFSSELKLAQEHLLREVLEKKELDLYSGVNTSMEKVTVESIKQLAADKGLDI